MCWGGGGREVGTVVRAGMETGREEPRRLMESWIFVWGAVVMGGACASSSGSSRVMF